MDKLHIGADIKDIDAECQSLRLANDVEQAKLEHSFRERTQKQQQIHQLEEEIKKVRLENRLQYVRNFRFSSFFFFS